MRNLSLVDYSYCELAAANIFEEAFWIGDVFVPENYTQAVSCDESEKWKLTLDSVNYQKEENQNGFV